MLNIIKAYLSLEMSAQDFASAVQTNDELVQFINVRIPQTQDKSAESWKQCPLNVNAFEHDNFDLRRTLTVGYYAINRISRCSTAYNMMWSLFHDDLPDVEKSTFYRELHQFAIDTVPDYLDSVDVGSVIQEIILSTNSIPKGKRQKAVRVALNSAFHLDALHKKPSWIQDSEWPLGTSNTPMLFLGQRKIKGQYVEYYFEDVINGEKRTITQYY